MVSALLFSLILTITYGFCAKPALGMNRPGFFMGTSKLVNFYCLTYYNCQFSHRSKLDKSQGVFTVVGHKEKHKDKANCVGYLLYGLIRNWLLLT